MNPREHLLRLLDAYAPHDDAEAAMRERMIAFVRQTIHALDPDHPPGHVTGSAWVLDPPRRRVLLTFHRKLDRWLQLGGHVDPGEAVPEAAVREAREESGLPAIALSPGIFDVDIHLIPVRGVRAAHLHYDVRFLCVGPDVTPVASAESRAVAWVALNEVARRNADPSMMRMVAKSKPA